AAAERRPENPVAARRQGQAARRELPEGLVAGLPGGEGRGRARREEGKKVRRGGVTHPSSPQGRREGTADRGKRASCPNFLAAGSPMLRLLPVLSAILLFGRGSGGCPASWLLSDLQERAPEGPAARRGRRQTPLPHFIQYHNFKKMGYLPLEED